MKRIAISGAVSVGKTTLVAGLTEYLSRNWPQLEVLVISNISRGLAAQGRVRPDKESSPEHYCLYVSEYIRRLLSAQADLVIHDRTLLDTLCYVIVNGNASPEFVDMLEQVTQFYVRDIELYFYLPIEIPVQQDGVRPIDPVYRETVDRYLRSYLNRLQIDFKTVRGPQDKRIDTAAEWLMETLETGR